jgi:hypothetical protein
LLQNLRFFLITDGIRVVQKESVEAYVQSDEYRQRRERIDQKNDLNKINERAKRLSGLAVSKRMFNNSLETVRHWKSAHTGTRSDAAENVEQLNQPEQIPFTDEAL